METREIRNGGEVLEIVQIYKEIKGKLGNVFFNPKSEFILMLHFLFNMNYLSVVFWSTSYISNLKFYIEILPH